MSEPFSTLKRETDRVDMNEREKSDSKDLILSFIKEHPVSSHDKEKIVSSYLKWPPSFLAIFSEISRQKIIIGGATLALGLFFIVAVNAEDSIPGNLLYPFKIGVNEKAQMAISTHIESKTDLSIAFAERRLNESLELIKAGSLDANNRGGAEWQILKEAGRINSFVSSIEKEDNYKALKYFGKAYVTFKAYEEFISLISTENPEITTEGSLLSAKIDSEANQFKNNFERLEKDINFQNNPSITTMALSDAEVSTGENMGNAGTTSAEHREVVENEIKISTNILETERAEIITEGEIIIKGLEKKYGLDVKEIDWFED